MPERGSAGSKEEAHREKSRLFWNPPATAYVACKLRGIDVILNALSDTERGLRRELVDAKLAAEQQRSCLRCTAHLGAPSIALLRVCSEHMLSEIQVALT